jgi:cytosine deaminase
LPSARFGLESAMTVLLLREVRPFGDLPIDILIEDRRIAAVGAGLPAPPGAVIEQGRNLLALPGLIEGHTHLDKTLWAGPWHRNTVGPTRLDRIEGERAFRRDGLHDAEVQSLALARAFLANGATRMRSHADIDLEIGLRHVHATARTRAALAGLMEIQIVAFPQSGLISQPGVEALMDVALTEGADVVGGIDPCAIDRDPVRQLDAIFRLATKHAKPIDIHLHEPGEMGAFSLDLILERVEALGLRGQVTVSHAFCLGMIAAGPRDALLMRMARTGTSIATTAPASSPVPPLALCRAAGVTVYGGNDGVRDTWTPYASPDMLARAMHIGLRNDLRRDDEMDWALDCVTHAAAEACGFAEYGLRPGCRADVVLLEAATVAEAIAVHPPRSLTISNGRIVARDGALTI